AAPAANSGELVGDDLDMSDLNLDDDVDFAAYTEVQKNPMAAAVPATGSTPDTNPAPEAENLPDSSKMLEQPYLDDVCQEIDRLKERQQLAINKMKDMQASLATPQTLNEINREIDVSCWQAGETAINYFKELYGYPRSLNQYMIKMADDEKQQLEKLGNDTDRLTAIKRIESSRELMKVLQAYREKTHELQQLIQEIPERAIKLMPVSRVKEIETIQTTLNLIVKHSLDSIAGLRSWQKRYARIRTLR
ncbi:MAG: hypothetical protein KDK39_17875, partial [Leptospiraceae bacterium]|nr:hypothetical protein [Leptospiraceae bacterium]